uniref:Uncharacterized protein n=1 Tax=Arundo donax TaxID=35708 RepID=A0A0A9E974_ARUDO
MRGTEERVGHEPLQ